MHLRLRFVALAFVAAISCGAAALHAADRVDSADPRLDAMYQLALQEKKLDEVSQIRDWAYSNNQPIPCDCYETGEKWNFVWTRDLSYAADLSLARHDPQRVRNSLAFKASVARSGPDQGQLLIAQDTGSGGSWPISTDRVVWFLAARHVLGEVDAFDKMYRSALINTLEQDRGTAFDEAMGLYRGETSFLDWREQTYPLWTRNDVTFIGESFALGTNVLHYLALRQAATLSTGTRKTLWNTRASALKRRIAQVFWDPQLQTLRSVVGPSYAPIPVASYDLLGLSLAIDAGIITGDRARTALASYPVAPLGSPVVWPQQRAVPIYHNRAMWPFVSAYALRAARKTGDVRRIAFEINSILDAAAKNGSNMENYELVTLKAHVDDGELSGPVVNSPRQLWSVAGMLMAIEEGIFGLQMDGRIEPRLPSELGAKVFGDRQRIALTSGSRTVELLRPKGQGNLWIADRVRRHGNRTTIQLKAVRVRSPELRTNGTQFAPLMPNATQADRTYVNGRLRESSGAPSTNVLRCVSHTRTENGLESLPSAPQCSGWNEFTNGTTLSAGTYLLATRYANLHGPINTGITAAVTRVAFKCRGQRDQIVTLVEPHSVDVQLSTTARVVVQSGSSCHVAFSPGTNMSDLQLNAAYTGGKGGSAALNESDRRALLISRLEPATIPEQIP